jgi:hypothetical protein
MKYNEYFTIVNKFIANFFSGVIKYNTDRIPSSFIIVSLAGFFCSISIKKYFSGHNRANSKKFFSSFLFFYIF